MTELHASKQAREVKLFSQQGGKTGEVQHNQHVNRFGTLQVTGADESKAAVNKDQESTSSTLQWDEKATGSG